MKKDEKKFNGFLPVDEGQFKCLVEKSFWSIAKEEAQMCESASNHVK